MSVQLRGMAAAGIAARVTRARAVGGDHRARQRFDLMAALVGRDVRVRYRRARFGLLWVHAAPLAQFAVLAVVFTRVVPVDVDAYPAFLLVGLLAWRWFADSVRTGTESITANRDLVRRPGFSVQFLPFAAVLTQLAIFATALPVVVVVVLAVTGRIPTSALALPLVMAAQALLLVGPTSLLAAAHARFRDVGPAVGAALTPLFYATPVLYAPSAVPHELSLVHDLNPVAHLLVAYRDSLVVGRWPDPRPLVVIAVIGAAVAMVGSSLLVRARDSFVDEL